MLEVNDFNAIRISLASPDQIRGWSYGEVTKPETINYRTLRPEKDGLFCERIFGPTKDWECFCGKYKRVRFKGIVCDKCGVEVTRSKVRRERMGHIELASPVSHIWYFKGTPSRIGLLLDITPRNLERILYFALYVVTHVNEEARQQALSTVEETIEQEKQELEEETMDRIKALQSTRDQKIAGFEEETRTNREEAEVRRNEDLQALKPIEAELRKRVKDNMGLVLETDLTFEPTGEVLGRQGEIVNKDHIAKLDKAIDQYRDGLSASTREEIERVRHENESKANRLEISTESEIQAINDRLKTQLDELTNGADTRRHDLETLKKLDLLTEQRYRELRDRFGHVFEAGMGAEAAKKLLEEIDLEVEALKMRHEIATTTSVQRKKKAMKRLNVIESFRKSNNRPEWMILTVLPVLPPELRPMVQLDGGRFATSDLNDLYRRVINRNNRLKRLLELNAPEIIIRNEKRMLQEACDALIDNGRRGRAVSGSANHKLKSLSDMLKGKQGRFRQNLLGKRVDYSGRSVIVVGPSLKLHQCGLPKKMALELFKPFVMRKLVERHLAHNIKSAKRFVERIRPEVWDVLEEVIHNHPVMLNRAPTLHRLGIQAFEAVLVEGSAIQLHPLVCSAFNADFDGDQMAVHVPLSERAQEEARSLMLSTRNILKPATGEPSIGASQEMVLGCYYMTLDRPGMLGEGHIYTNEDEALLAYDYGHIQLQSRIKVRLNSPYIVNMDSTGAYQKIATNDRIVDTTVGRILFNEALPEDIRFKNYATKKEHLSAIIAECFRVYGRERTAELADAIKSLGFMYSTRAGASIAISDVQVPEERKQIIAETEVEVAEMEEEFRDGLITENERYKKTVDFWTAATKKVEIAVKRVLDPYGSIAIIADSGSTKAKLQQIRQLSGMRGLMADPSGRIIEVPIRGNFRQGLSVIEYFISSHGARKGLADTALRTAESGYLTRRLIDVAQDVIVNIIDCGATEGVWITKADSDDMNQPMRNRLVGRILAADVELPDGTVVARGEELEERNIDLIVNANVNTVYVRSVLQCLSPHGICQQCYGRNLGNGRLATFGDAMGIIAAQSIGEPGTQLTMRTFHTGGIAGAQEDITQGLPRIEELFESRIPKDKTIISEIDGEAEVTRDDNGAQHVKVVAREVILDEYPLPKSATLSVRDGDHVTRDQLIATRSDGSTVLARVEGDIILNAKEKLAIRFEERSEKVYDVPPGTALALDSETKLTITNGSKIRAGQAITKGLVDPQDVLRIMGRDAVSLFLVKEVQKVYRSTGVYISDKHIEVIVRQMLRRVRIDDPGDTDMLPGDLVDRFTFEETNKGVLAEGGEPATAATVLLGVTKASLNTESFLAAASFQETTRVLTEAAINGATDHLLGLKENVIIGKLIPAGTGFERRRELAAARNQQRVAEAAPSGNDYDPMTFGDFAPFGDD
ncbi:MAG: DNA-directed RNA polymerase subunit beta' [Ktedonobacterales bacterium]|nr:DNA-directed RNA polymerase subunit beta' [Ktedonobacterales bacterium]